MARWFWILLTAAATLSLHSERLAAQPWQPLDTLPAREIAPHPGFVTLQQVTWDLDAGRVADSDWGQVSVNIRSPHLKSLGAKGYLNVFLSGPNRSGAVSWVVSNLLITTHPGRDDAVLPLASGRPTGPTNPWPATAHFDLRPGVEGAGRLDRLPAIVLYSSHPLPTIARIQELAGRLTPLWFTVQQIVLNPEGDLGESFPAVASPPLNAQALVGPPPQAILADPEPPLDFGFPKVVTQAAAPNLETAKNQCVPMAFANALQYLEDRYDAVPLAWSLPHSAVPGIGRMIVFNNIIFGWEPVPADSLIARIDARTRRLGVLGFLSGNGSTRCQQIQGVFGYVANETGTAVSVFRHQGGSSFHGDTSVEPTAKCDLGWSPLGGYVSTRQGEQPTWEWMFAELQAGRAVVINFGYYDVNGNRTGGHMQRVWGAGRFSGRNYLYTLDDGNQGLGTNGGLRTQSWEVADTGQPGLAGIPDGRLNMGGTNWEIEYAASVEAKPTLNIP